VAIFDAVEKGIREGRFNLDMSAREIAEQIAGQFPGYSVETLRKYIGPRLNELRRMEKPKGT